MPLPILNVVADTPEPAQGEIDDKPMPAPKANRRRLKAAVATAPAAIAAQDTPEVWTSTTVDVPRGEVSIIADLQSHKWLRSIGPEVEEMMRRLSSFAP